MITKRSATITGIHPTGATATRRGRALAVGATVFDDDAIVVTVPPGISGSGAIQVGSAVRLVLTTQCAPPAPVTASSKPIAATPAPITERGIAAPAPSSPGGYVLPPAVKVIV